MSGTCYIVGAMETPCPFVPQSNDIVIAADAGYAHLQRAGIVPDRCIGDFDSLGVRPNANCPIDQHPTMKDATDMGLSVAYGWSQGYRNFMLYGGVGGRTDHTIANLQTLAHIALQGGTGFLWGDREGMTLIANRAARFPAHAEGILSVFAFAGEARGVSETGLRYTLNGATLSPCNPLGVSNEFIGVPACVEVTDGTVLLIWKNVLTAPNDRGIIPTIA